VKIGLAVENFAPLSAPPDMDRIVAYARRADASANEYMIDYDRHLNSA